MFPGVAAVGDIFSLKNDLYFSLKKDFQSFLDMAASQLNSSRFCCFPADLSKRPT